MPEEPNGGEPAGQQQDPGGQVPPWEANGQQFDPERAWQLIQNLQTEREGLKTERDGLRSTVTEHEQANLTELQKITQRAEQAEGQVPQLQSENDRLRAALTVGLDADLIDRLRGSTFDELKADAEQLKQRFQAPAPQRFDHGPRQTAAGSTMNDLIFGSTRR